MVGVNCEITGRRHLAQYGSILSEPSPLHITLIRRDALFKEKVNKGFDFWPMEMSQVPIHKPHTTTTVKVTHLLAINCNVYSLFFA